MEAHSKTGAASSGSTGAGTVPGIFLPRWLMGPGRQVGKYLINPLVVRTLGGRMGPAAVVRHVGRRSGRTYATPVYAAQRGDDFLIPLFVGSDADWVRNVLATGQCMLQLGGNSYALNGPEVVDQATGLPAFPLPIRLVGRLIRLRYFLRLSRVGATSRR
ncbi:MAG: nitroreductase/quinone reductase family protein [Vicinamibacterales bacterium]